MDADDVKRLEGRLMAVETIVMLLALPFLGHPGMVKLIVEEIRKVVDAPRFNEALDPARREGFEDVMQGFIKGLARTVRTEP